MSTWQNWNALAGGWWSLHGIAVAEPGSGVKLLQHYVAAPLQATIINTSSGAGGVRIVAGFGEEQDAFEGHVGTFTIGVQGADRTYNFASGPTTTPVEIDIAPADYPNTIDCYRL